MTEKISRNVCKFNFLWEKGMSTVEREIKIAMLSDIHWDNPHCDRVLLKAHLDYCLEQNIPIHVNGDFFCLMQGRGDPRRSKADVRPEHANKANYIDAVIKDAVEWFKPYAPVLKLVSYGNHETGIIKHQETDPLQRFVDLFNYETNAGVIIGGYGGWIWVDVHLNQTSKKTFKIKYFHGSGGGGIVTKGAINLTRALETYEGFDVFTIGHIHENWCRNDVRETLLTLNKFNGEIKQKELHLMVTGTYKDEYEDGYMGFHIEKGRPPKLTGGRILTVKMKRVDTKFYSMYDSYKFPLPW